MGLRTKVTGKAARGTTLDVAWGNTRLPKDAHGADESVSWS